MGIMCSQSVVKLRFGAVEARKVASRGICLRVLGCWNTFTEERVAIGVPPKLRRMVVGHVCPSRTPAAYSVSISPPSSRSMLSVQSR